MHLDSPAKLLWIAAPLLALLLLTSCSNLGYYGQAAWGQTKILLGRRSIDRLAADPKTPQALREKLQTVQAIRRFAARELLLPADGSYRTYVELPASAAGGRRTAVVWNVVVAPELSIEPLTWCFPVAGCVAYRGYFSEARARRFADRLQRQGYDVAVAGAAAYSTLGWFEDPVLSTVIDYSDVDLAGLLFHELAHQLLYVQDDTRFNESFAT
ncbi:MAG: aminopeptidase, partial [Acidobacteriota bacterium]